MSSLNFGSITVKDGRAICNGEDWGPLVQTGEPLPCCGCEYGSAMRSIPADCACRCHETPRAWLRGVVKK